LTGGVYALRVDARTAREEAPQAPSTVVSQRVV
jgi:hypothetical protein